MYEFNGVKMYEFNGVVYFVVFYVSAHDCIIQFVDCVSLFQEDFKIHFRNISRIIDCVGCDKCRLWGKLQVKHLQSFTLLICSQM